MKSINNVLECPLQEHWQLPSISAIIFSGKGLEKSPVLVHSMIDCCISQLEQDTLFRTWEKQGARIQIPSSIFHKESTLLFSLGQVRKHILYVPTSRHQMCSLPAQIYTDFSLPLLTDVTKIGILNLCAI